MLGRFLLPEETANLSRVCRSLSRIASLVVWPGVLKGILVSLVKLPRIRKRLCELFLATGWTPLKGVCFFFMSVYRTCQTVVGFLHARWLYDTSASWSASSFDPIVHSLDLSDSVFAISRELGPLACPDGPHFSTMQVSFRLAKIVEVATSRFGGITSCFHIVR